MSKVEEREKPGTVANAVNRRSFVKGAGITGLTLAGATMLASKTGILDKVEAGSVTDVDILNFALNLEYLEAEFYTVATTGKRIADFGIGIGGLGTPGPTEGGKQVNFDFYEVNDGDQDPGDHQAREFSRKLGAIAREITYDEQQHVILLRAALGADAVAKPAIDLDALGMGFSNYKEFLRLSRAFEDTGTSAYGGAAPLITSKEYLAVAVRIGLTEAQHTGNLRLLVAENAVPTKPLDNKDVLPPPSGSKYFLVDQQALTIVRTVSEVLAIVYANAAPGTSRGGFFPNGVNGNIRTV